MNQTERIENNKSQGNELWLDCSDCNNETCHTVLLSLDREGEYLEYFSYWEEYQIVQCNGCKVVSFRTRQHTSEDIFLDDVGNEKINYHERVYPPRLAQHPGLPDEGFIPTDIWAIYKETHEALCNNQLILAAIGIRAIIEAVCIQQAVPGKNLLEKIDELTERGAISRKGSKMIHGLRVMGNKAAHQIRHQEQTKLSIALNIVEHLLQGIYILPLVAPDYPDKNNG